jgi:hypothetical protein
MPDAFQEPMSVGNGLGVSRGVASFAAAVAAADECSGDVDGSAEPQDATIVAAATKKASLSRIGRPPGRLRSELRLDPRITQLVPW